jgi:hypothetical protein
MSSFHVPTSVSPGTKFGILPTTQERKQENIASATPTKAHLGGGGRMAQKSPDYEDQKFEIAICKSPFGFGRFLHVA